MTPRRLERLPRDVLYDGSVAYHANTFASRLLGLAFLDELPPGHALFFWDCRSVHTFGMRFPIDVAFLDRERRVTTIVCAMRPWRFGAPRIGSRAVIEAEAGCFERWNLQVGDQLEVRG